MEKKQQDIYQIVTKKVSMFMKGKTILINFITGLYPSTLKSRVDENDSLDVVYLDL